MKGFLPVLLVLFGNAVWAQPRELWVSAGGSILSHTEKNEQLGSPSPDGDPGDLRIGNGYRFGFRFAFNSSPHIGHEIQYAYNRTRLTDNDGSILGEVGSAGTAFHQGGYNLLYYFWRANEESKIRPFVTAGVHFSDFVLPGSAAVQGSSVRAGFNYGTGLKLRISTLFSVRFDLREYETGKPNWKGLLFHRSGLLHQTEASAGFGFFF
jgi:outer membrane protein W